MRLKSAFIFCMVLAMLGSAFARDKLVLSDDWEDKTSISWPMLPGDSLTSLAARLYPKDEQMQRQFVQKTQRLNARELPQLNPDRIFFAPVTIEIPTAESLSASSRIIKPADEAAPQKPKLQMSYNIQSLLDKKPRSTMDEYTYRFQHHPLVKGATATLNRQWTSVQSKWREFRLHMANSAKASTSPLQKTATQAPKKIEKNVATAKMAAQAQKVESFLQLNKNLLVIFAMLILFSSALFLFAKNHRKQAAAKLLQDTRPMWEPKLEVPAIENEPPISEQSITQHEPSEYEVMFEQSEVLEPHVEASPTLVELPEQVETFVQEEAEPEPETVAEFTETSAMEELPSAQEISDEHDLPPEPEQVIEPEADIGTQVSPLESNALGMQQETHASSELLEPSQEISPPPVEFLQEANVVLEDGLPKIEEQLKHTEAQVAEELPQDEAEPEPETVAEYIESPAMEKASQLQEASEEQPQPVEPVQIIEPEAHFTDVAVPDYEVVYEQTASLSEQESESSQFDELPAIPELPELIITPESASGAIVQDQLLEFETPTPQEETLEQTEAFAFAEPLNLEESQQPETSTELEVLTSNIRETLSHQEELEEEIVTPLQVDSPVLELLPDSKVTLTTDTVSKQDETPKFETPLELKVQPKPLVTPAKLDAPPKTTIFSFSAGAQRFSGQVPAKSDKEKTLLDEAKLLASKHQYKDAITVLKTAVDSQSRAPLDAWLFLLELLKDQHMRSEFEDYSKLAHRTFNMITPMWDSVTLAIVIPKAIEEFPHIVEKLTSLWPQPEAVKSYLQNLVNDNRNGDRMGFSVEVVEEMMLLLDIAELRLARASESQASRY